MKTKPGFYWLVISISLFAAPQKCLANAAASLVAERIYRIGNQYLEAKQYSKAFSAYDVALVLDPQLEAARTKKEEWVHILRGWAERGYVEGLKALQNKKFDEAKKNLNLAWHDSFFEEAMDLHQKIEKTLKRDYGRWTMDYGPTTKKEKEEEKEEEGERKEMAEVKGFLEKGDVAQAVLSLSEMVDHNPQNERAKVLLSNLREEQKEKGGENVSQEIKDKFKEAAAIFSEGEAFFQKKEYAKAYQRYKKAFSLFSGNDLRPPFYQEWVSKKEEAEKILQGQIQPLLEQWQKALASPSADLKEAGGKLKEIEKNYPPSSLTKEILEKVYAGLQEKASPLLMRAKTLQELEGCRAAVDKFASVKEAALFPEVPAWQEAQINIQTCLMIKK